jgi:hypothetical protein
MLEHYSCCGVPGFGIPGYIILQIALLAFVWYKAEEYGMDPLVWLIAVLLFGPLAFIVFVILILSQSRAPRRKYDEPMPPMGKSTSGEYIPPPPEPVKSSAPDPNFRDDRLEELLESGKTSEARKYMREMIETARDMNDITTVRNYSQYVSRINKAATRKREEDNPQL